MEPHGAIGLICIKQIARQTERALRRGCEEGGIDAVLASVHIVQVRITRSRVADETPEAVDGPLQAHLGLMDFYRAEEAIAEGQGAAEKTMPFLLRLRLGVV
jgi:predicted acylesterase/phospholipase RssA